ncbi:MAG: ATP-binding protein [Myxococcales bacterium]|nr:ATP-binding protein [Myxococcales bacterium]
MPALPGDDLEALADAFRMTGGQIREAAAAARAASPAAAHPPLEVLLDAARRHVAPRLGALASLVVRTDSWEDLVLPQDRRRLLEELVRRHRFRQTVMAEWGFGRRHADARGIAALFSGPSGTGKTMAAAIVARELGLDLYRVDLSQIVSKYIGETEKHLAQVFAEAEASEVALFFDEADALFGKRSSVQDAHDRYANIEVAYLLQRIESYPGVVIMASNLRKNLDDAFLRRLQVIVEFAMPSAPERAEIWRRVWPREAPLAEGLDPADLADRFEVSGGNIRNIAVGAAFAAAEEGSPITRRHVIDAARAEYLRMSKLIDASRFA